MNKISRTSCLGGLLMLALTGLSSAQTQAYDETSGSDVWGTTTAIWLPGPVVWNNVPTNSAVFGGLGESVDVNGAITFQNITFNSTGYTLHDNTADGSLTLAPVSVLTVTNALDLAIINEVLDGATTTSLTKSGLGILELGGANTYTGVTTVGAGTLRLNNAAALGSTATANFTAVSSGATLDLNGITTAETLGSGTVDAFASSTAILTNSSATTATVTGEVLFNGAGAFTVNGANNITLSNNVRRASGTGTVTLTKADGGTLTLGGGANNSDLALVINGGTVILSKTGAFNGISNSSTVNVGGTLKLAGSDNNNIQNIADMTVHGTLDLNGKSEDFDDLNGNSTGLVTNTATNDPATLSVGNDSGGGTFRGVIQDGAGTSKVALTKNNAGTFTLTNNSTYTGATTISGTGGALILDFSAAEGTNDNILATGTSLSMNNSSNFRTQTFRITGDAGVTNNQALTGVSVVGTGGAAGLIGRHQIVVTSGAGGTTNFNMGAFSLGATSSYIDFVLPTLGSITASNGNTILGPRGTINNGSAYAQILGGQVVAFTGNLAYVTATDISALPGYATTSHLRVDNTSTGNVIQAAGTTDLSTVQVTDAADRTLTVGTGNTLRLGAFGGILRSDTAGNVTIGEAGNAGSLTTGTLAGADLAFTNGSSTGTLTINSNIVNNAGGAVDVVLNGAATAVTVFAGTNSLNGLTSVQTGTLRIASDGALGGTGGLNVQDNAAIELSNNITTGNKTVSIIGTGVGGNGAFRNVSGNNTFGGVVTLVAPAEIQADSGTALTFDTSSASSVTGNFGLTLETQGTGTMTFNDALATGNSVTKTGAGMVIFNATNNFSTLTINSNGGVVRAAANGALAGSGGTSIGGNSALELIGGITITGETITLNNSTGISAGGAIRNISGDNTLSGGSIVVDNGSGRINSDTGLLTITGDVRADPNDATARTLTFGGSGNITVSGRLRNGAATGAGSALNVVKDGTGILTISGSNVTGGVVGDQNFTGTFIVNSGTVVAANVNAFASAASVALSASTGPATLRLATDTSVTAFAFTSNTSTNQNTLISDRATSGVGITHVLGAATFGNNTLNVEAGSNVASGTAGVSFTSASLAANVAGTVVLNPTSATVTILGGVSSTSNFAKTLDLSGSTTGNAINGAITNGTNVVSLIKSGTSTWTLGGTNTYTGTTSITGGTLNLTGSVNATAITVGAAGTLNATGTNNLTGSVSLNTSGITNLGSTNTTGAITVAGGTTTLTGAISAAPINVGAAGAFNATNTSSITGTSTFTTSGTTSLAGTVNTTGPITIAGGTTNLSGSLSSASLTVNSGATFNVTSTATLASTVNLVTGGNTTLSSANAGATTTTGGTLTLDYTSSNTSKLADDKILTLGGGTVVLSGGSHLEAVASTTLAANSATSISRTSGSSVLALGAITAGSGSLLNINGNDIASTTTANVDGMLAFATVTIAGDTNFAVNSGATDGGTGSFIRAFSDYTDVSRFNDGVPAGPIPDNPALTIRIVNSTSGGSANLALQAATTRINGLKMAATDGPAIIDPANSADVLIVGGESGGGIIMNGNAGALTIGNSAGDGVLTTGGVANAGAATLSLTNESLSNDLTVNSNIANNGSDVVSFTKAGAGRVVLTGANTFTGSVVVGQGTLHVGELTSTAVSTSGGFSAGTVVNNNGTLIFRRTDSAAADVAGAISGTGSVTYNGTNVAAGRSQYTVNNASTYSGGTTVGLARVSVSDAAGFGTGTVTVQDGGQVFVGGAITIANNFVVGGNGWLETAGNLGSIRFNTSGGTISGNVSLAANTRFTATTNVNAGVFSGAISGNFGVEIGEDSATGRILYSGSTANTYTGLTTLGVAGANLQLNKTSGVQAIAGDILIAGGGLIFTAGSNNTIADTSNITMTAGAFNGTGPNGNSVGVAETFASLTATGGVFNSGTDATGWTITGAASFSGTSSFLGNSASNVRFGSLSLTGINAYSTGTGGVGPGGANSFTIFGSQAQSVVTVGAGGLTMNDSAINMRLGTGGSRLILNGDVTTTGTAASAIREDGGNTGTGTMNVDLGSAAGAVTRTFNVGSGGADLTVGIAIRNGVAAVTTGNLTKAGGGTMTLSAVNTYNGKTQIDTGTLALVSSTVNNNIQSSHTVEVASGATFDVSGISTAGGFQVVNNQVIAGTGTVNGSTTVVLGTVSAGNTNGTGVGALTFTGNLTAGATSVITHDLSDAGYNDATFASGSMTALEYLDGADLTTVDSWKTEPTSANNDYLSISGSLALSGNTLSLRDAGYITTGLQAGDVFNLMDWTGVRNSSAGNLGTLTIDVDLTAALTNAGLSFDTSAYSQYGVIVVAVPEPGRALLLVFGLALAVMRRRR